MPATTVNWGAVARLFAYDRGAPVMFNTGPFLLLFTLFFAVYMCLHRWPAVRRGYLLLFNFYFYFMACGTYIWLLAATVLLDYWLGLRIEKASSQQQAKAWLTAGIVLNLGALAYFKYTNFSIEVLNLFAGKSFSALAIFLPIGISFFSFQSISYKVDIYRKQLQACSSLPDYAFYLTFFPHLVAGPIVRARDFLYQIHTPLRQDKAFVAGGFFLVVQGFFKKAVLSDYVAQYVDMVYARPLGFSGLEVLMAVYGYALQIFCDFSGYTDMAIGLAALLGYTLCDNFDSPYRAADITDFWRRWHISLSSWLRDYLYIPLGGNRQGPWRQALNQFATMVLGGLWHGASVRFILWGAAHGVALVVHKVWRVSALGSRVPNTGLVRFLSWLVTFHIVAACWILFRAPDMKTANLIVYQVLYHANFSTYLLPFVAARPLFVVVLAGGFGLVLLPRTLKNRAKQAFIAAPWVLKVALLLAVIQISLEMGIQGVQPFIYFQF